MRPSFVVAVAMCLSVPGSGYQDTVLTPHDVEIETLLGGQGPGDIREVERKIQDDSISCFVELKQKSGRIFELVE